MYAKLFTSIYQGTLRGNSRGLLVFTNLLAHADSAGHVDIHPRAIADEVGLAPDEVRAALDELEAPDVESRTPDEDGRRIVRLDDHRAWGWRIVNYAKYRAIKNEDDRREQNRLAQARWRAKQSGAQSASVSEHKHDKPESAQAEAEAEAEVDKYKAPSELPALPAASPAPPAPFGGDSNLKDIPARALVQLAAGWELPEAWGLDAEALGWQPRGILVEAEKFRQYYVSGGGAGKRRNLKGWRQSWSNWLGKAAERQRA